MVYEVVEEQIVMMVRSRAKHDTRLQCRNESARTVVYCPLRSAKTRATALPCLTIDVFNMPLLYS